MIAQERLDNYIKILKNADWSYQYAEGQAFYDGERSVRAAFAEKTFMLRDFPDDAVEIVRLWSDRGGCRDLQR